MKQLAPFEFTPTIQPDPDDPVIFTLRPLDFAGDTELTAAQVSGPEGATAALRIASKYVNGWKGGGQDPVNSRGAARARLREVLDGAPSITWKAWLTVIALELLNRAEPSEEDAKKF